MNKVIKIFLIIFLTILFVFGLISCNDEKDTSFEISIEKNEIDLISQNTMPIINYIYDNQAITAEYDDFWYLDDKKYVFVQYGKIFTTENAPLHFETELNIILRKDKTKTLKLIVKKATIELEDVKFGVVGNKKTCLSGKSLNFEIIFYPENTSFVNYTLTLNQGAKATISNKTITVDSDATVGEEIKVTFLSEKGFTSEYTITVSEKIEVKTAKEFFDIRENPTLDYEIVEDIDLIEYDNWVPIPLFWGTLNGGNNTIKNLKITIPSLIENGNYGLFAENFGEIFALNIIDSTIYGNINHRQNNFVNVGIMAGNNFGKIEFCQVSNSIVEVYRGWANIGGMVGVNKKYGLIISSNVSNVSVSGNGDMGGIAGIAEKLSLIEHCSITDSKVSLDVIGNNVPLNRSVGGMVGILYGEVYKSATVRTKIVCINKYSPNKLLMPRMGIICGTIIDGSITGVGNEDSIIDVGTLEGLQTLYAKSSEAFSYLGWFVYGIKIGDCKFGLERV